MQAETRFFVLTGGPGAGKTTLIDALATRGHPVIPESGRGIIRAQLACGGDSLPWGDRTGYARRMLCRDVRNWDRARMLPPRPVFFERGIPDVIGYRRLCGLPALDAASAAAVRCRSAPVVFIAPFWDAIYHQDAERRQDAAEARRTCDTMRSVYAELGYLIETLPAAPVAQRVDFVLERLGGAI